MKVTRYVAPVREQTVMALREAIQSGELAPGTRLVEREICEELQVSRNTLREAYRQLETEGLLEIRPNRGPVVYDLTDDEARELYEVREALEAAGIMLFTVRATDEERAAVMTAGTALAQTIEHGTPLDLMHVKDEFYAVIFGGARNSALFELARINFRRLSPLRQRSLSAPGRPAQSAQEVRDVLAAIEQRDAELAERRWRLHVHNAATAAFGMPKPIHGESSTAIGT